MSDWEKVLEKLNEELGHIHTQIMHQQDADSILKLEQAMAIVIRLRERWFG